MSCRIKSSASSSSLLFANSEEISWLHSSEIARPTVEETTTKERDITNANVRDPVSEPKVESRKEPKVDVRKEQKGEEEVAPQITVNTEVRRPNLPAASNPIAFSLANQLQFCCSRLHRSAGRVERVLQQLQTNRFSPDTIQFQRSILILTFHHKRALIQLDRSVFSSGPSDVLNAWHHSAGERPKFIFEPSRTLERFQWQHTADEHQQRLQLDGSESVQKKRAIEPVGPHSPLNTYSRQCNLIVAR